MKLKVAQAIGLNTDQKAAQVISESRDGDNSFFAVLDLTCDDAFTKGRQVLGEISDFYFDFEGTPAEKLKAAFEQSLKKFETEEVALLLAALSGKVLYLISQGAVEAMLKRDSNTSPLLSVGALNQLISGFLKEGDKLLLSTSSLVNFLGEDLNKLLDLPAQNFEEEVTGRISGSDPTHSNSVLENQDLAALLINIEPAESAVDSKSTIPSLGREVSGGSYQDSAAGTQSDSSAIVLQTLGQILGFIRSIAAYLPKGGRSRLLIAVVLIIIVASGVGFKVKSSKDAQKEQTFKQVLQQAKDDFNAAKNIATLNSNEAKGKLDSAKDKVNQALGLKPKEMEAQALKKQIEQDSGAILQQFQLSEFPIFLDLDLVKKNFTASKINLSANKLILLDPAVKTLVLIDVAKKSPQILAGSEQLGDAQAVSLNGALAFVFSKDKGVLKIDSTKNNLASPEQKITSVSKKDSELDRVEDIYGFASNVYLLDIGKNKIWKYLPASEGYSDKKEYLTKNTQADFTDALRMQIESSVYVLKKDGSMLRFTRGDKDNFSYDGLDKNVKDPKSFFVSSDTDNLYLLDSGNSRLLILTKTGGYKAQMSGEKFGQATDLVVDEKGKKVYLLDGSKIFQVDLK